MSVEIKTQVLTHIAAQDGASFLVGALFREDGVAAGYECELWDYKQDLGDSNLDVAELCRDVVSFHNAYGGYLVFGVSDDYGIVGFRGSINQQTLRQKLRHYFGADIAVVVEHLEIGGQPIAVVCIPKRSGATVVASRQGPALTNNKPIFTAGAVFFRVDDSCQLIRGSEDLQFLASARLHSLEATPSKSRVTQSNLPERSAICPKLIGRSEVKSELWLWLADKLSRYRVVAGPGGFGKTSAAYYFAEDVAEASANGFFQVLWLSAKKNQFSASQNTYRALPYSGVASNAFHDIESLLTVLSDSLAISSDEWLDASTADMIEMLAQSLEMIPSFIVLDDLDSLTPDEQRQVVHLVMQIAAGGSKFLLTTRNNFVAPDSSMTRMPGLRGEEFRDYVAVLSNRFDRTLSAKEVTQLEKATQGSPLFAESVFRLMKLGSRFGEALKLWEGKDGEAARAACFKREVLQLTFKSRRALFAMSRVESASMPELCRFAELERVEAGEAIQELDQLFLCSSEEIAGEPRFRVPDNLRQLLNEEKAELVPEYAAIERRVAALKKEAAGGGKSRGKNAPIAAAIRQAMAQLGADDSKGACSTVDEALRRSPESADLWMVKARCYSATEQIDVELVRGAFEKSYLHGKREARLFEKWIDFELAHGNSNAAVDVGEKGTESIEAPAYTWFVQVAQAHNKRGEQRLKRGESEDAAQDFRAALKNLSLAFPLAPAPARSSIRGAIERATEGVWATLPAHRGVSAGIQVLRMIREAMQSGDRRPIWVDRAVIALAALGRGEGMRPTVSEFENLMFLVEAISKHLPQISADRLRALVSRIAPGA